MTWTESTFANLVRVLARRLRLRLEEEHPPVFRPLFRDRTLTKLQAMLAEAQPHLTLSQAAPVVVRLNEALYNLTPTDLRQSHLLRTQVVAALADAEIDLKEMIPSPWIFPAKPSPLAN
jgi:hypothetical protein